MEQPIPEVRANDMISIVEMQQLLGAKELEIFLLKRQVATLETQLMRLQNEGMPPNEKQTDGSSRVVAETSPV